MLWDTTVLAFLAWALVVTLWMLLDCLLSKGHKVKSKTIWISVVLLVPVFGPMAYGFWGMQRRFKNWLSLANGLILFFFINLYCFYQVQTFLAAKKENHRYSEKKADQDFISGFETAVFNPLGVRFVPRRDIFDNAAYYYCNAFDMLAVEDLEELNILLVDVLKEGWPDSDELVLEVINANSKVISETLKAFSVSHFEPYECHNCRKHLIDGIDYLKKLNMLQRLVFAKAKHLESQKQYEAAADTHLATFSLSLHIIEHQSSLANVFFSVFAGLPSCHLEKLINNDVLDSETLGRISRSLTDYRKRIPKPAKLIYTSKIAFMAYTALTAASFEPKRNQEQNYIIEKLFPRKDNTGNLIRQESRLIAEEYFDQLIIAFENESRESAYAKIDELNCYKPKDFDDKAFLVKTIAKKIILGPLNRDSEMNRIPAKQMAAISLQVYVSRLKSSLDDYFKQLERTDQLIEKVSEKQEVKS